MTAGASRAGSWQTHWPAWLLISSLLLAWEAAVRTGAISPLLAPAPSAIMQELVGLVVSGEMLRHIGATLLRMTAGLAIGAGSGIFLGLAMGWIPWLRRLLDPMVSAMHPIPKVALFPLLIVVLGIGESSKVAAIALAAFFPSLINSIAGVRGIAPVQLDLARNYGAGPRAMLFRILLPGSLPMVLTGLRVASSVAFLSAISIEMVAAKTGLGALVWLSWQLFRIEQLYATIIVIAAIGITNTAVIRVVRRHLAPWLPEEPYR
jgi:NitT/TauT family transport system permease protein